MGKLLAGAILVPIVLFVTLRTVIMSYVESPDYLEELCRVHGDRMLPAEGWELEGDEEFPFELARREFPNCGLREFSQVQGRDWVSRCYACSRSLIDFYSERIKQKLLATRAGD